MVRGRSINSPRTDVRPYPQESLLIDAIDEMSGQRLLSTSLGLAQFAVGAAAAFPHANVTCTYLDSYHANQAIEHWQCLPPNLQIDCAADFADCEVDLAAFPLSSGGEADLTRDVIQTGHQRLRLGGRMYAATENVKDTWLGEQLQKVLRKVERRTLSNGVLYVATKTEPLKKIK